MMILVLLAGLMVSSAWADDCNICRESGTPGVQECSLLRCLPPIPRTIHVGDSEGNSLLTCTDDFTDCRGKLIEQNSCYQRMQEAMKAMDFVVRSIKFRELLPDIAGRYIRENDTWLSTMRDCVKDKP